MVDEIEDQAAFFGEVTATHECSGEDCFWCNTWKEKQDESKLVGHKVIILDLTANPIKKK